MTEIRKKVIFVGDGGVGKTSILASMLDRRYKPVYTPTLGVDVKPVSYKNMTMSIWDTAGQEKYGGLRDGYYIGADLAVVFFDLTNTLSFKSLSSYIRDIRCVTNNIPIILAGNKLDVIKDRKIDNDTIAKLNVDTILTSAKTGSNVSILVDMMYDTLLNN